MNLHWVIDVQQITEKQMKTCIKILHGRNLLINFMFYEQISKESGQKY